MTTLTNDGGDDDDDNEDRNNISDIVSYRIVSCASKSLLAIAVALAQDISHRKMIGRTIEDPHASHGDKRYKSLC